MLPCRTRALSDDAVVFRHRNSYEPANFHYSKATFEHHSPYARLGNAEKLGKLGNAHECVHRKLHSSSDDAAPCSSSLSDTNRSCRAVRTLNVSLCRLIADSIVWRVNFL